MKEYVGLVALLGVSFLFCVVQQPYFFIGKKYRNVCDLIIDLRTFLGASVLVFLVISFSSIFFVGALLGALIAHMDKYHPDLLEIWTTLFAEKWTTWFASY